MKIVKHDFLSPIQQFTGNRVKVDNLEQFLDKDFVVSKKKSRVFNLIIITILALSLTGLGAFSYWQSNQTKKPQVAGIQDTVVKNIVSGNNFSIILSEKTPNGFEMVKTNIQSPFFEQKTVVNSSFVKKIANGTSVSGIQIISAEYDSKLDQASFAIKIKEILGEDWSILSEDINLPGQVLLSKIQKKDKSQSYYTTATKNYYYVISVLNPPRDAPEYSEIRPFVENLLPNLNLN